MRLAPWSSGTGTWSEAADLPRVALDGGLLDSRLFDNLAPLAREVLTGYLERDRNGDRDGGALGGRRRAARRRLRLPPGKALVFGAGVFVGMRLTATGPARLLGGRSAARALVGQLSDRARDGGVYPRRPEIEPPPRADEEELSFLDDQGRVHVLT